MARHKYTHPPVMTPIASGAVTQMSTPILIDNYREAQTWARRFGEKLNELRKIEKAIDRADTRGKWWSRLEWVGDWVRKKTEYWKAEAHRLDGLRTEVEAEAETMRTHTQFDVGDAGSSTWLRVEEAFEKLCTAEAIWDITAQGGPEHHKSSSSGVVQRNEVRFALEPLPTVRPDIRALHVVNANGPDLWIYPRVVAVGNMYDSPALIDLREMQAQFSPQTFIEEQRLPRDAQQVEFTWRYVNKDGGPDRRFADNPRLPVLLYGEIDFVSNGGLFERFHVSDVEKAKCLATCLAEHKAAI